MGNENTKGNQLLTPAGINSMDEALQKKFSKGVQYNMKIVLRGDRNTGKTNLFRRMEGKQFDEAYTPTSAINVTSILWSYKVTSDTVKVEVWDVVDKGKPQKKGKVPLKLANEKAEDDDGLSLDADFLDVYKNANGVVFVYDITKLWTWQYIERELPRVPMHIPIIILGNFRDMEQHRVITQDTAMSFIEHLDRPEGAALIRYAEGSMKDAFGLMHLYKFLSIPFLHLQQEALLQQLRSNREQILAANEELEAASKAEDQNYELYKETVSKKAIAEKERKRKEKEEMETQASAPVEKDRKRKEKEGMETQASAPVEKDRKRKEKEGMETQASAPVEKDRKRKEKEGPEAESHGHGVVEASKKPEIATKQAQESPESPSPSAEDSEKLMSAPDEKEGKEKAPAVNTSLKAKLSSRFAGFMSKSKQTASTPAATVIPAVPKPKKAAVSGDETVAEFVPDGDGVQTFLGEEEGKEEKDVEGEQASDEDDELGVAVNPLVARDEDLSSLEGQEAAPPPPAPAQREEKRSTVLQQEDVSSGDELKSKGKKSSIVQQDEDLSSGDELKSKKAAEKGKKSSIVQQDEDLSSGDELKSKKAAEKGKKSSIVQQDEDLSSGDELKSKGKKSSIVQQDEDLSSGDELKSKKAAEKGKKSSIVQQDEDLSSDDELQSKGKKSSIMQQDEDLSSDGDDLGGQKKLVVAADKDISSSEEVRNQKPAPVAKLAPPPKAAPPPKVQLKSAKEIVLTESEEEEEPAETATMVTKPFTVKPSSQGFMLLDQSDGPVAAKEKEGGKKTSGLLLGWKEPQPQSSPEISNKIMVPANGSPVTPSKKEKKSSKKDTDGDSKGKKSSKKVKGDGEKSSKKVKGGSEKSSKKDSNGAKQEPVDPFAPLSLDAWLDGDDDTKDLDRTDGDEGKGKHKKKKSDSGKKSKRKASDGGENYATL